MENEKVQTKSKFKSLSQKTINCQDGSKIVVSCTEITNSETGLNILNLVIKKAKFDEFGMQVGLTKQLYLPIDCLNDLAKALLELNK